MFSSLNSRKLSLLAVLSIFVFSMMLSFGSPSVSAAPPYDMPELEKQRTILYNFSSCVSRTGGRDDSIIDTNHGHFGDREGYDSIGNWMDDDNYVVGLNVDTDNGVWSCLDILIAGINILIDIGVIPASENAGVLPELKSNTNEAEQKRELNKWFTLYVTGTTWEDLNGQTIAVSSSQFESRLNDLKALADAEYSKMQITDEIKQTRYIRLFNICYDSYPISNGQLNLGGGDFSYPDTGTPTSYHYIKNRGDADFRTELRTYVREGGEAIAGDDRDYYIDEIRLGFDRLGESSTISTVQGNDFDIYGGGGASNWFPLGTDIEPDFPNTSPGPGKGIADCGIFKDNQVVRDIMLGSGVQIDPATKKLVFMPGVNPHFDPNGTGRNDVDFNLANDAGPSCEGADALGWILCPVITGLLVANEWIFSTFILPFLIVDPINTNGGPVYAIWSSFRTVGNILLVFALLFIVFGQAIGGGLVDAYTAKKAMPRIFIAAILINISIYIVAFMVDMGNILGAGLGTMITAPLAEVGGNQYSVNGGVTSIVLIGLALSAGLAMVLFLFIKDASATKRKELGTTALYIVGFMAIPALLVVLGIFFTLVVRLGVILLLTVLSPVALAMFAIPATDKYAKKWFDFLVKSILVYPIIIVLFAVAQVLSSLLSAGGNPLSAEALVTIVLGFLGGAAIGSAGSRGLGGGIAGLILGGVAGLTASGLFTDFSIEDIMFSLVSIFVLFIPLALIPFSFRLAGGIMGSLLGAVTKGRSGADKLIRGDKHEPGGRYHGSLERLRHRKKETGIQLGVGLNKVFRGRYKEIGKPDIANQKGSTGGIRGFSSANRRRSGGAHRVGVIPKPNARVNPELINSRSDLNDGEGPTVLPVTQTTAASNTAIPITQTTAAGNTAIPAPTPRVVPGADTGESERSAAAEWARTQTPVYTPPANTPPSPGETVRPRQTTTQQQPPTEAQQAKSRPSFGGAGFGIPGQQARGGQTEEDNSTTDNNTTPPTNNP